MITIGLTGSPQSGKSELEWAISGISGVDYVDIFAQIIQLRATGSPHRSFYEVLMGEYLKPDWTQRFSYYTAMPKDRHLFERIREADYERIAPKIQQLMFRNANKAARVISWVNWPLLIERWIMPDHIIYLECQNKEDWYKKIRERVGQRFWTAKIADDVIEKMLRGIDCHPEQILPRLEGLVSSDRLHKVDTTGNDWGIEKVKSAIGNIIQA